jgi:hypothetical protein
MAAIPLEAVSAKFADSGNVQLQVSSWASSAVGFHVRGFGEQSQISHSWTHTGNRAAETQNIDIENIPISLGVTPATAGIKRGQLYVRVRLRVSGFTMLTLLSGYVCDGSHLSYPPVKSEPMNSGKGYVYVVTGTDPAAKADISEAVPSNALWRIESAYATLVCSASAANRYVNVVLDDGSNTYLHLYGADAITAGQTAYIIAFAGFGETIDKQATFIYHPLPTPTILPEGHRIRITMDGDQDGDNFSAPRIKVEEWLQE